MDLMKYIEAMRRYAEREGHYPPSWEERRREQRELAQQEAQREADQPTWQRFIPRSRRWPWK